MYRQNPLGQGITTTVKYIIIANVVVFLLQQISILLFGHHLEGDLSLRYPLSDEFSPFQFVSYLFTHADTAHLVFNMYGLWLLGTILEREWGSKRFYIYYMVGGIGSAMFFYVIFYFSSYQHIALINDVLNAPSVENINNFLKSDFWTLYRQVFGSKDLTAGTQFVENCSKLSQEDHNMLVYYFSEKMSGMKMLIYNSKRILGASGAVYAVLLAHAVRFPDRLISPFFFLPGFLFQIKMKYFVLILGVASLVLGYLKLEGDNIAHFGHLGGIVTGGLLLLYWKLFKRI